MATRWPWLVMLAAGPFFYGNADFAALEKHAEKMEAKLQQTYTKYCSSSLSTQVNCTDLQIQINAAKTLQDFQVSKASGTARFMQLVEALQTVAWNPGEDPHDWLPDQLSSALSTQDMQMLASMASNKSLGSSYFWEDERPEPGSRLLRGSWTGIQIAAGKPWTNRTMVYAYHPDAHWTTKRAMKSAIAEIEQKTCIKFREVHWTSSEKKVRVIDNQEGCWSSVGMTGHRFDQELNLALMCRFHWVAVHEILHALGQTHEQARQDRDNFLDVKMSNVQTGFEHNFDKDSSAYTGRPYDYKSIMHYSRFAFSTTTIFADPIAAWTANTLSKVSIDIGAKPTLDPRNTGFRGELGNSFMSDNDVEQLQEMYQCDKMTVSSDGSPGWGFRFSTSTGVSLNTGQGVCLQNFS